jgi:hypothetical protein
MIPFKKDANSEVIRVPLATKDQSLLLIDPSFIKVHLRRLICSTTGLPRRGKSSIVIYGINPFDFALSDLNSSGRMFFSSR